MRERDQRKGLFRYFQNPGKPKRRNADFTPLGFRTTRSTIEAHHSTSSPG